MKAFILSKVIYFGSMGIKNLNLNIEETQNVELIEIPEFR